MYVIGTIRRFETENFTVIVDAVDDTDLDISFDETGEVAAKLESGKYIGFCARARVMFEDEEIASDYLGGCIYESLDAFMDHRKCGRANRKFEANGDAGRCGSYFSDMIHTVCDEAREHLTKIKAVHVRQTKISA